MSSGTIKWAGYELAYTVEVSSWGSPSSLYDPGEAIEFDVTELWAGIDGDADACWLLDTTHLDAIIDLIHDDLIASAKHDKKYSGD